MWHGEFKDRAASTRGQAGQGAAPGRTAGTNRSGAGGLAWPGLAVLGGTPILLPAPGLNASRGLGLHPRAFDTTRLCSGPRLPAVPCPVLRSPCGAPWPAACSFPTRAESPPRLAAPGCQASLLPQRRLGPDQGQVLRASQRRMSRCLEQPLCPPSLCPRLPGQGRSGPGAAGQDTAKGTAPLQRCSSGSE